MTAVKARQVTHSASGWRTPESTVSIRRRTSLSVRDSEFHVLWNPPFPALFQFLTNYDFQDSLTRTEQPWECERRLVTRLAASEKSLDIRYIVTFLTGGAGYLYETVYCARGKMEKFIKLHKAQLASGRTFCRNPRANQFRLILHTAAYWLMLAIRKAVPERDRLFRAEFATLRLRLIKIAARVVEAKARIRVSLPSACPDVALFRHFVGHFAAAGPQAPWCCRRSELFVETSNQKSKSPRDATDATLPCRPCQKSCRTARNQA